MTPAQDAMFVAAIAWATLSMLGWIGAARRARLMTEKAGIFRQVALLERNQREAIEAAHPGEVVTLFDQRARHAHPVRTDTPPPGAA